MPLSRRMLVVPFLVSLAGGALAQSPGGVKGRWLGQDGHDTVGEPNTIAPNGVQDIHIVLSGLPARKEILTASVTGHGADEWQYNKARNQFAAVLKRKARGTTADIFIEPLRVEKGREFSVKMTFDDRSVVEIYFQGGRADPNLRMPGAGMAAKWVGQARQDHAGGGPGVGPDGLQDAMIAVSKLSKTDRVKSVVIAEASGVKWAFGTNPEGHHNAEFLTDPKDPGQAGLFFQPVGALAGKSLKVTVTYESGKRDSATVAAGRVEPKLAMPTVTVPKVATFAVSARWVGQDGTDLTGPGDVRVVLSKVPVGKAVAGAVLTDSVRGAWVFKANDRVKLDVDDEVRPLVVRRGGDPSTLELVFPPYRDESKSTMTLRLISPAGASEVATFEGGACDPSRRAPGLDRSDTAARPGDDLAALVDRGGMVRLNRGVYALDRPLELGRRVTIVGEPGAVLRFTQKPDDAPWTTAIKIHAGGTTLKGFAVRFTGPVRWRQEVSYGPAVIGTTDNLDNRPDTPKPNLQLDSLDLESPPARDPKTWEEATRLMRLRHAPGGRIVNNTLRGGMIEFFDGPWLVADNHFRGTPPGTFSPAVFAMHDPHDAVVRDNDAKAIAPSGKTWRFLLFTTRGQGDLVEKNRIEGVGPRDDDTIPSMNSPEIILTESYHLRFEGKLSHLSPDGRVVAVHTLPGQAPRTGDVVSALFGPSAGEYRRIAQRLDSTIYLLEKPFTSKVDVVAIAPGFVGDRFEGNTIEASGGHAASGIVLAGNHYGTRVLNNRVVGAGDAFQLTAYPTESPNIWGWSHAPFLGGLVAGNTLEDCERGGQIGVLRNESTKSNKGRVYMTVTLKSNTVRWSDAFLSRRAASDAKTPLAGITLGYTKSLDPGELVVTESGDRLVAPGGAPTSSAVRVEAAVINGRPVSNKSLTLPLNLPTTSASGSTSRRR